MTALIDGRPGGLDAFFRPGNTFPVAMTWPAGYLAGRSYTARLDAAALALGIVGDVLTVTVTEAQTAAAVEGGAFVLTETTGGLTQDVIAGNWSPSTSPGTPTGMAVNVTIDGVVVQVSVAAAIASPEVAHDWSTGWTPFTPVVMTADGAQAFAQTAGNGRGMLAGTLGTNPSLRVAYLLDGTDWADAEMTSLVLPPTGWVDGLAQQGHIHRVREVSPGLWEGIAIWTSVVGSDYRSLHIKCVRWDGVNLLQGAGHDGDPGDTNYIDRGMRVRARDRTLFGQVRQTYKVIEQPMCLGLVAGDKVDVVEMTDTSFNESGVAIDTIDIVNGIIAVIDPAAGPNVADGVAFFGKVLPDANTNQKRWTPYWMTTRVRGGTASSVTVEVKRWRPEDAEPDWGDARVKRQAVTPNGSIASMALGPGRCALWAAHFINTSSGSWGGVKARQL